jgi:hypothetical protein
MLRVARSLLLERAGNPGINVLTLLLLTALIGPERTGILDAAAYRHAQDGPSVELWTNHGHGEVLHRGNRVRVFFRTDDDAYVTVFRVDTDGRVRILHPDEPWEDNFARGGRAYEIDRRYDNHAFVVDDYPGEGYLFAIATLDPFDYRQLARGDHWDYRAIAAGGRVTGDPYEALQVLADLMVPANYETYTYDVYTYYVERRYDYPRFLCYDCHTYAAYPYWDPYRDTCIRFRIVIYDDPYYYPARAYPATRVVYRPQVRLEPRFVFKDRSVTDAYVVRVRQRPSAEPASRRPDERGATGDAGAAGTVRTPQRTPQRETGGQPAPAPTGRVLDPAVRTPATPQPRSPEGRITEPATGTPEKTAPARSLGGRAVLPDRRDAPKDANPRLEPRATPERREPAAQPEPRSGPQPAAQPRVREREPAKEPSKPPAKPPAKKPPEPRRRPG